MFQALFNSLSGLFSFSRSLNTISNNVANMNTPGFRGSDTFFSNVFGGQGTTISGEGLRTQAGDIRQTGNATDVAVSGNGFLILRDPSGNLHYTRAGQFRFGDDGLLVDAVTGYQVMSIDASGNLTSIDLDAFRALPPAATSSVNLVGNISPSASTFTVEPILVYDAAGTQHSLTLELTADAATPGRYTAELKDDTGAVLASGVLQFAADGTPLSGADQLDFTFDLGGSSQTIAFDLGEPGSYTGATRLAGGSTNIAAQVQDGNPVLGLADFSFDQSGVLQLVYSDSQRQQGPQLALASIENESQLGLTSGRLISGLPPGSATAGKPGEGVYGTIVGGSLELSNVDLTQEFADMIIIQRGYQASSRVMTVSNEMIEQLYNSTRGG